MSLQKPILTRRSFVFAGATISTLMGLGFSKPASAQGMNNIKQMSAPNAANLMSQGKIILVDIRRESEWREDGLAKGALPISMHKAGFVQKLIDLKQSNPDKKIALICATGGRTAYVQGELTKMGFGHTVDISEGMHGNGKAAGWLKRGMAVEQYKP